MKPIDAVVLYDGQDIGRKIGIGRDVGPVVPESDKAVRNNIFRNHAVADISSCDDYKTLSVLIIQLAEFLLYDVVFNHALFANILNIPGKTMERRGNDDVAYLYFSSSVSQCRVENSLGYIPNCSWKHFEK